MAHSRYPKGKDNAKSKIARLSALGSRRSSLVARMILLMPLLLSMSALADTPDVDVDSQRGNSDETGVNIEIDNISVTTINFTGTSTPLEDRQGFDDWTLQRPNKTITQWKAWWGQEGVGGWLKVFDDAVDR